MGAAAADGDGGEEGAGAGAVLDGADLDAVDNEVVTLIDQSVALGEGGARPTDADLTTDVYSSY